MAKKTQQQQLDSLRRNRNAEEEGEDEQAAAAAASAAKYRPRKGRQQREEDEDERAVDGRAEGEAELPSELESEDETTDEDDDGEEDNDDDEEEEGEEEEEEGQSDQRSVRAQHSGDGSGSSPPIRSTAGSDAPTRNGGSPAVLQLGGRQPLSAQFGTSSSSGSSMPASPLRVGQLSGNGGSSSSTGRRAANASRFSSNQPSSRSPSPTVARREERLERRASRQLTTDRSLPADAASNDNEEQLEAADSQLGSRASRQQRAPGLPRLRVQPPCPMLCL